MAAWTQQWTRLDRRQRRLVVVLGILLFGWLIDFVILRPLRTHLVQLRHDVRETEQRLKDALVAASQADAVSAAFEGYRPYLSARGSPEAELAAVLTEVEAAVRDAGMVLLSLKPASQASVDVEATPGQLVRVLDRLQRSVQLLKVTELSIRVSEDRTLRSSLVVSKLLL